MGNGDGGLHHGTLLRRVEPASGPSEDKQNGLAKEKGDRPSLRTKEIFAQPDIKPPMEAITTQWIDDYLGLLEDIAGLWKSKDISLKEVYHSFGYYVTLVCEDQAITEYVAWARSREGKAGREIYEDLFDMYKAIQKFEGKKK